MNRYTVTLFAVMCLLCVGIGFWGGCGMDKDVKPQQVKFEAQLAEAKALVDSLAADRQKLEWLQKSLAERQKYLDRREQDLAEAASWLRDGLDPYTVMVRPFHQAIATGIRRDGIKINSVAHEALLTLEERAKFSGVMALADGGSYSDLVQPCLGDYQAGYDSLIVSAPNDSARAEIFFRYASGLHHLLHVLDAQIWQYEKFRRRADRDFNGWYTGLHGYAPADSDRCGIAWDQFLASHPTYAYPWPGFWSDQVGAQQGDRPVGDYHGQERRFLERELARLGDTLTLAQYRALARIFPDRIGMWKYHQG